MKHNYFFTALLVAFFYLGNVNAQSCPPTGFSNTGGNTLYFLYDSGTSLCVDRPTTVTVGASVFTRTACDDLASVYQLTSGSPISPTNTFTADFGYGTCEYTDGTLTDENLSLEDFKLKLSQLKVFPNPVLNDDKLFISFENVISTNIKLFNVTGKLVLEDTINSSNSKAINISGLTNGVYLLQLTNGKASVTKKVVIMK
jgi:hypothetical protein